MVWVWQNDLPTLASPSQAHSELYMTSGYDTTPKKIPEFFRPVVFIHWEFTSPQMDNNTVKSQS
jgi:hypothetical protein